MTVEIHQGSILEVKADAIVNPANSFMNHAGGLAAVINSCAQGGVSYNISMRQDWPDPMPRWQWETEYIPAVIKYNKHRDSALIPVGGAILGPPGALSRRFKAIIHAVGPVWGGGNYYEYLLLMSAYAEAITLAEQHGFESLAAPAIGAGVFGCPIGCVARAGVQMASNSKVRVIFALMTDEHVDAFQEALRIETNRRERIYNA